MPQKISMIISNGNTFPSSIQYQKANNLPALAAPKAPSALNAPFIARVHNVRPGCGSCGRH